MGLGRDPGPDYPKNIRAMAFDLSMRRIDAVGFTPTEIVVIEITHSAGLTAIGQVRAYPVLYALTFHPSLPVRPLLVAGELQSDIRFVLEATKTRYILTNAATSSIAPP